jgi:hypothetical protein
LIRSVERAAALPDGAGIVGVEGVLGKRFGSMLRGSLRVHHSASHIHQHRLSASGRSSMRTSSRAAVGDKNETNHAEERANGQVSKQETTEGRSSCLATEGTWWAPTQKALGYSFAIFSFGMRIR